MMNEYVREIKVNGKRFIVPNIQYFNDTQDRPKELCEVLLVEECLNTNCDQCIFDHKNFDSFCQYMKRGEDK